MLNLREPALSPTVEGEEYQPDALKAVGNDLTADNDKS